MSTKGILGSLMLAASLALAAVGQNPFWYPTCGSARCVSESRVHTSWKTPAVATAPAAAPMAADAAAGQSSPSDVEAPGEPQEEAAIRQLKDDLVALQREVAQLTAAISRKGAAAGEDAGAEVAAAAEQAASAAAEAAAKVESLSQQLATVRDEVAALNRMRREGSRMAAEQRELTEELQRLTARQKERDETLNSDLKEIYEAVMKFEPLANPEDLKKIRQLQQAVDRLPTTIDAAVKRLLEQRRAEWEKEYDAKLDALRKRIDQAIQANRDKRPPAPR